MHAIGSRFQHRTRIDGLLGGWGATFVSMQQMKNPEMKKMMNNMMKNLTPEQMKSMAGMGGMNMSDQQAESMATQMRGMKEEDLEKMLKYAAMAQKYKDMLMRNKLIVLALLILLLGVFLRWMGWA